VNDRELSNGSRRKFAAMKVVQALTKTVRALYSTPAEMYPKDWGHEIGYGPQSERAAERANMAPRKVPIGRGRAFVKR